MRKFERGLIGIMKENNSGFRAWENLDENLLFAVVIGEGRRYREDSGDIWLIVSFRRAKVTIAG
jgi:hypothetical protein